MTDENSFTTAEQLQAWLDRLGGEGLRSTGSLAHERVLDWIEDELRQTPGVSVQSDRYDLLRWRPIPEGALAAAGSLRVLGAAVEIAGAVPYSRPGARGGPLVHIPAGEHITPENARGKVILRPFPKFRRGYDGFFGSGLFASPDLEALRGHPYDRPGRADLALHTDLLAAGQAQAAGMIVLFDVEREQVAGYFEPHKGTHYELPAVFVGIEAAEHLLDLAAGGEVEATVSVRAAIEEGQTRNIIATLPGQTAERIVLCSHTDGNTWVQENGVAALLALARHFSAQPLAARRRTIEFAFTSAHLHISREGARRHAAQLDLEYDQGGVAFVFAVEHLGARELAPLPRATGSGRRLTYTGEAETAFWCVGPSPRLRTAVIDAVRDRGLPRTFVLPGLGPTIEGQAPKIASFGGIGTYFHNHLIPTASVMAGPWSLWAPHFGRGAVDAELYRAQVLTIVDIVQALDSVSVAELAGDYPAERRARAEGAALGLEDEPPERARPQKAIRLTSDGYPLPVR